MLILFYITLALLLAYGILLSYYESWWKKIPVFTTKDIHEGVLTTKITVIIPARNEEKIITACLQSLAEQTYPKELLQIIVVNDHSTDNTEQIVSNFPAANVIIINLSDHVTDSINSYKKKAIEVAIAQATGELIVTTDADCIAPQKWIETIAAAHHRYDAAFIAAPVKIEANKSLLSVFQSLDFLTLQGITGASAHKRFHSMCNGANLAYEKKAFYDVGGFKNIDAIASGDDMLLMHKIALKYPERIFYLKSIDAIVNTRAAGSWKDFFNQRVRWASKADKYNDKRIFFVLLLVYLLNLFILIIFFAGFIKPLAFLYAFLLILIKVAVEISFVKTIADFFQMKSLLIWFPLLQPLHILYIVIAGFFGKFSTYKWKGRKVK